MYVSVFELKQGVLAFLNSTEAIYSPSLNATAQRLLKRLTNLNRNSLSIVEIYNLIFDCTVLPWRKDQTTQQLIQYILRGIQYA